VSAGTQGTVAANAEMDRTANSTAADLRERLVDGDEAVIRVNKLGIHNAVSAVIPVGAVEALVADASDVPVATIADGVVALVTARRQLDLNVAGDMGTLNCGNEGVLGVVAVEVLLEACVAQVEVLAGCAVEEAGLGQLRHAGVASAHAVQSGAEHRAKKLTDVGRRLDRYLSRLLNLGLGPGGNRLGSAVHDLAVLDDPLDEPVVDTVASDALIDAVLAKVEVAVVAGRAVVVGIGNCLIAAVAAHGKVGVGVHQTRATAPRSP